MTGLTLSVNPWTPALLVHVILGWKWLLL